MRKQTRCKNVFADKATLILRKMLREPDKKWVVRDFTGKEGLSIGMAQGVLEAMEGQGYVERIKKGPESYSILVDKEKLIEDWLKCYKFELNEVDTYYSSDKNVLKKIKGFFKDGNYALTLHSGANMITSYVRSEDIYIYLEKQTFDADILNIRQGLDLKELVRGGNIHFVRPYYKNSVFFNSQKIKGYRVVSNLQLYLDLYNFQPRGREHAGFLKQLISEKGGNIEQSR
ncbi:type IV toxin-antitoxin system AbiEi family antitoxin [Candidatus Auribacterota bacterium]